MGQVESVAAAENRSSPRTSTSAENSSGRSLDSLIAEAAAYGDEDDGSESLDQKARRALDCPCVAHLRSGPCGAQFSEAFVCFLKSTAEEKGSDCVHPFVVLQSCIKANPDAFSKDVLGDDEEGTKEEDVTRKSKAGPKYKVRPPLWSVETKAPKK